MGECLGIGRCCQENNVISQEAHRKSLFSVLEMIALTALLTAVSYYALTTLRIDYHNTPYLDLEPRPDATEYFAGAVSLYHKHRYTI